MTSDAKLGLVAGVVGVLLTAVVYHHKPATTDAAPMQSAIGTATTPPTVPPAAVAVPRGVHINADLPGGDPLKRI